MKQMPQISVKDLFDRKDDTVIFNKIGHGFVNGLTSYVTNKNIKFNELRCSMLDPTDFTDLPYEPFNAVKELVENSDVVLMSDLCCSKHENQKLMYDKVKSFNPKVKVIIGVNENNNDLDIGTKLDSFKIMT